MFGNQRSPKQIYLHLKGIVKTHNDYTVRKIIENTKIYKNCNLLQIALLKSYKKW